MERRAYPPGQHGQSQWRGRRKTSEYAKQLREKQKVKRMYGLTESQFRNTFEGVTRRARRDGHQPARRRSRRRLDNVVYRMGFAASRKAARQLVRHGHVEVNGRRVDIPSYRVLPGEEVRVAPASRELVLGQAGAGGRAPRRSRCRGCRWTRTRPPAGSPSARPAMRSRSTPRNSSSSSSTRSDHDALT